MILCSPGEVPRLMQHALIRQTVAAIYPLHLERTGRVYRTGQDPLTERNDRESP